MIELQNSQFSPCSVAWDPSKNQFRKNTKDEVYLCCNKKCDSYRTTCSKSCGTVVDDTADCHFSCNVMGNVCNKICESARFDWNQKIFDPCLKTSNCLKGEILNNKCLTDKKDELLKCCLSNCKPEENLNCEQHCGISYDINLERSTRGGIPESVMDSKIPKKNNKIYISFIVVSVLLIIFFIIILKRK